MGVVDLNIGDIQSIDRQQLYGTDEVHAEIWIESDKQADQLVAQLAQGAFGKCSLARRFPCRTCPDRVIVRCPLTEWASAVSALGAKGWRPVASSAAEAETDHIPFDTLVLLTRAEASQMSIYEHLSDVSTRGHAADTKAKEKKK